MVQSPLLQCSLASADRRHTVKVALFDLAVECSNDLFLAGKEVGARKIHAGEHAGDPILKKLPAIGILTDNRELFMQYPISAEPSSLKRFFDLYRTDRNTRKPDST